MTAAIVPPYRPGDRLAGMRHLLGPMLRDNPQWGSDVLLICADAYAEAAEAHRRADEIAREKGEVIPALARNAEDCERARDRLRALAPWFAPGAPEPQATRRQPANAHGGPDWQVTRT